MIEIIKHNNDDLGWHFQSDKNGRLIFGSTEGYEELAGCLHSLALAAIAMRQWPLMVKHVDGTIRPLPLDAAPELIEILRQAAVALRAVTDSQDSRPEQELAGAALLRLESLLTLFDDSPPTPG